MKEEFSLATLTRKYLLISFGLLFIILGITLNERTITILFSPDGIIDSTSIRLRIWVLEGLLILVGFFVIIYREKISFTIKNFLLVGIGFLFIIVGVLLNEWIVARIFGLYGLSAKISVWSSEVVIILIGVLLITYRNRISLKALSTSLGLLVFSVFFSLCGAELILRVAGYHPEPKAAPFQIHVEPGGKLFRTHPTLGFTHLPGEFIITYPDGHSFKATHLPDTLRITHPANTYNPKNQKEDIWILGGSFTYGAGLNDEETYSWLLQEQFPEYEFVNYGVSGYGTLQSLIQFQEALQKSKQAKIVVLAYASFHDERNVFLRSWRNMLASQNRLGVFFYPYARIDHALEDGFSFCMGEVEEHRFPLIHYSALMSLLDKSYNAYQERMINGHEVSKRLIKKFFKLARENGATFIVAGIMSDALTREMLEYCRAEGIMTLDMSVDMTLQENIFSELDRHPTANANRKYAKRIERFLKDIGLK